MQSESTQFGVKATGHTPYRSGETFGVRQSDSPNDRATSGIAGSAMQRCIASRHQGESKKAHCRTPDTPCFRGVGQRNNTWVPSEERPAMPTVSPENSLLSVLRRIKAVSQPSGERAFCLRPPKSVLNRRATRIAGFRKGIAAGIRRFFSALDGYNLRSCVPFGPEGGV